MGDVTDMTPEEFDRLEAAGEPVKIPKGRRPRAVLKRTSHIISSTVPGGVQLGRSGTAVVQSRRPAVIRKSASLTNSVLGEASSH